MADASKDAGLGHLSRSSALARALLERGLGVSCHAMGATDSVERYGVRWSPLPEDVPLCDALLEPVLVVDSYRVGIEELQRLDERRLVLMHDDAGAPPAQADLMIGAHPTRRNGPGTLGGLEYACLGPDYWSLPPRELRPSVGRVLVATGGGDPGGLAWPLAASVRRALPEATVALVAGPQASMATPGDVEIVRGAESLVEEMQAADLAVTTAGQTLLEAAATGLPVVAVIAGDDQRAQAEALVVAGGAVLAESPRFASVEKARAGLAENPRFASVEIAVRALAGDRERRERLARGAQAAVDGEGARRIARRVAHLAGAQG